MPRGTAVELERDAGLDDADGYGRLLRYVTANETNVNVELVRRGAAAPYFFRGERGRLSDRLLDAVAEARRAGRGMWGACRVSWRPDAPVATHPRYVSLGRGTFAARTQTFVGPTLDLKRAPREADDAEL